MADARRNPGSDRGTAPRYHPAMRNVITRLACLLPLAACVPQEGVQTAAPAAWEALAERVPETMGTFRRGTPNALPDAATGREFPFATANRAIAGYVQIRTAMDATADADLAQQVQELTQAGPAHRRLRERARPASAGAPHCAELDGTFGRTAVDGLACSALIAGNMVRIRLTMQRRDGRLELAREFARGITASLSNP
jgi:hypothetical protein